MSMWTYVHGTIVVQPMGRTQPEKRYILETVLDHLPLVTGSERNMDVYVVQKNGHNSSCSSDEFGYRTNNLVDYYGNKSRDKGSLRTQCEYIIVVDGSFRDRELNTTLKEFNKWLCRLAKRIGIQSIMVKISDYNRVVTIENREPYAEMFVSPSWSRGTEDGEENWCEYLMWSFSREGEENGET